MELWSQVFLEDGLGGVEGSAGADLDWATCAMGVEAWKRLTDHHRGVSRLIAKIELAGEKKSWYCSLGTPLNSIRDEHYNHLYLPAWMVEQMGIDGCGERAKVKWISAEGLPEATHIVLKPQDSAFYYTDAREELERGLTRIGVLQQGSVITVPLESLGGYPVSFGVVRTEPAEVVLAQGDEVTIEFEEAHDYAAQAPVAAARQEPAPTPAPQDEDFGMVVPLAELAPFPGQGQRLGGSSASRRTADGKPWNPWRDGGKLSVST